MSNCLKGVPILKIRQFFSTYNIQAACDVVNGDVDMTTIVFDLICAADQVPYYSFPNNNNNYQQQMNLVIIFCTILKYSLLKTSPSEAKGVVQLSYRLKPAGKGTVFFARTQCTGLNLAGSQGRVIL